MTILLRVTDPVPLTVELVRVDSPDGAWDTLAIEVNDGRAGAVVVATDRRRTAFVRQWRPLAQRHLWELPRGFAATSTERAAPESPVETAVRELREETGVVGHHADHLGTIWADSGLLRTPVHVVHVQVPEGAPSLPGAEVDACAWWTADDVRRAIRRGELCDALSLAALALASAMD